MATLLAVLLLACGGAARAPVASTRHARTACGRDCRIYRGDQLAVPECHVPEDCGTPPHIQAMQCIAGGRCVPVCQHHWADCDEQFRNGCEQAIADRHYCPGDPRIGAVSDPSVSFLVRHDEATGADTSEKLLARSLATQASLLQRCYQAMLARHPELAGESVYRITFSEAGDAKRSERLDSATEDPTLTRCEEHALRGVRIDQTERTGDRHFLVEVMFAPGGPDTEAE